MKRIFTKKQLAILPHPDKVILANEDTLRLWFEKNSFPLSDKLCKALAKEVWEYQLWMFKRGRLFEQLKEVKE